MFSWTSFSALSGMYVWTNEARLEAWIRKEGKEWADALLEEGRAI